MTSFVVTGIKYGLTGRSGAAARFQGALRVEDGVITEMGDLTPAPNERVVDAFGCVVTPGFVNTHHHLFQSLMKSIPATINGGLDDWVMEGPYRFWPTLDEDDPLHAGLYDLNRYYAETTDHTE